MAAFSVARKETEKVIERVTEKDDRESCTGLSADKEIAQIRRKSAKLLIRRPFRGPFVSHTFVENELAVCRRRRKRVRQAGRRIFQWTVYRLRSRRGRP